MESQPIQLNRTHGSKWQKPIPLVLLDLLSLVKTTQRVKGEEDWEVKQASEKGDDTNPLLE